VASLAQACPDLAFAWLARARLPKENGACNGVLTAGVANLYAMADAHNGFPSLAGLGAFVVCAGETDVTLPLAAAAMGIPLVGFSTGGMTELLGRYGILCHGDPNASVAGDVLRKIAAEAPSSAVHDEDQRRRQLDVGGCVDTILQLLADVRLTEPDEIRTDGGGS